MIQSLSRAIIQRLLESRHDGMVATIYAPMHRSSVPAHLSEDRIRLKNLGRQAEKQAQEAGDRLLAGAIGRYTLALADDQQFGEQPGEGLLLCIGRDEMTVLRLPVTCEEYVVVGEQYMLAPVLGLLDEMQPYYVLAVARKDPQLFAAATSGLERLDIALPASIEAGLHLDEPRLRGEHHHTVGGTAFNGRGGTHQTEDIDRQKFFRLIDQALLDKLDTSRPLLLAGIDTEVAEFRALSRYPNLLQASISGSYSGAQPGDLRHEAEAIVRSELIEAGRTQAIADYRRVKGETAHRALAEWAAIHEAAQEGRVDTLLVHSLAYTPDTVSDSLQAQPCLTFAAYEKDPSWTHAIARLVWRQGGRIVNLATGRLHEMPQVAAVLRY